MINQLEEDVISGFFDLIPKSKSLEWLGDGGNISQKFENFEFRLGKSSGLSLPSTKLLLDHIAEACDRNLGSENLLLLSSGKDSMGLLLGYSQLGYKIDCLSIVSDEEEALWISKIVSFLGHRIRFLRKEEIFENMLRSGLSLDPVHGVCYDQAIVVMNAAFQIIGLKPNTTVIDGMGNDVYFGHIPSRSQLRSYKIGLMVPVLTEISSYKYYFRQPFEAHGLASAFPFFLKVAIFSDFRNKFFELNPDLSVDSIMDYRAFVRGSYIDDYCYAEKTRVLAKKYGYFAVFPWMSKSLSDYVFNLPIQEKFNFPSLTNKLLLRQLLRERLNYARPKKGIDVFEFLAVDELLRMDFIRQIPDFFIKSIVNNNIIPVSAKKRAMIECGLFVNYCNHISISPLIVVDEFIKSNRAI